MFFVGLRGSEYFQCRLIVGIRFFGNGVFDGTRFGMFSMSFDFWNAFLWECRV